MSGLLTRGLGQGTPLVLGGLGSGTSSVIDLGELITVAVEPTTTATLFDVDPSRTVTADA